MPEGKKTDDESWCRPTVSSRSAERRCAALLLGRHEACGQ